MKLHEYQYEFKDLISIVASKLHIPESAVERDYYLTPQIRLRYETLHKDLLYTDEQQKFDDALHAFSDISKIFAEICE